MRLDMTGRYSTEHHRTMRLDVTQPSTMGRDNATEQDVTRLDGTLRLDQTALYST